MKINDLFYADDEVTIEALKQLFRENDYTTHTSKYDFRRASNEENEIYLKAKKFFRNKWRNQMKSFGDKSTQKAFTTGYPLKLLEQADENLVAGSVMEILRNDELCETIFDAVFVSMDQPINEAVENYADSIDKDASELTDKEIAEALDFFADEFLAKMMNLMMQSQSVEGILETAKKHPAHEDFSVDDLAVNYDKIDFERAWNHTRSFIGELLSLDEKDEETEEPKIQVAGSSNTEQNAIFNETFKRFIDCLDSVEREIVYMRLQGATQEEIAQALQYKSQSAVSKRIKCIQEKYRKIFYSES